MPLSFQETALPQAKTSRRAFIAASLAAGAAAQIAAPAKADLRLIMNDASRLNPTPVIRHIRPKSDRQGDYLAGLRAELKDAAASSRARLFFTSA